jgi:hypothetical protein
VHFAEDPGTNLLNGPGGDNYSSHSVPDSTPATTRISVATIPAPLTPGTLWLTDDAHVFGAGFPLTPLGNGPHKEGMIYKVTVQ